MSAEMSGLLITIPFMVLICLPIFFLTWLATKYHKVTSLKTDFRNPRKEAILSIFVVVAVTIALTGLFFLLYQNKGGTLGTPSEYNLQEVLFQWGLVGALFILPVLAVVKARHLTFETVGITRKNAGFSIALGLVLGLIVAIFGILFGSNIGKLSASNVFYGFVYFSAVGFGEELLMRGYFQTRCISWLGTTKGLILASVTMALYHLPQRIFAVGLDPLQALVSAVGLIPISFAFGFLMLRTKNILGPTFMHVLIDWVPSVI
jgi:membrane protease YdiL (CAAX protease family)